MPMDFTSQDDNIEDLEDKLKEARKKQRKADKEAEKETRKADAYAAVTEWLDETPIYYIAALDHYVIKKADNNWEFLKPAALPRTYPILKDNDAFDALPMAMEEMERTFINCTYTFNIDRYPQTLNLLDTTDWLKPVTGKHHWVFDVLIQSLGCDKRENMEHLKEVITFKYEHPDCWLLPCIVIYGAGRVGKNVLVDAVLHTMFCGRTVSATTKFIIGDFNSMLKGKVAVCINETVVGKHDRGALYDTLAKARVPINEKGIRHYEVDNTPLFFIGSNDWTGGTQLDRGESDERLSLLCCERGKTLRLWVALHEAINEDQAQDWLWTEGKRIFSDPHEVGKWLNYLLETYGGRKQPKALHGADYMKVMDIQQKLDEAIINAVFRDEGFDYISVVELHEGYQFLCKERGSSYPIGLKLFNQRAEMWLQEHMPHIVKRTATITTYKADDDMPAHMKKKRVLKRKTVWVNSAAGASIEQNNRDKYLDIVGYKTVWVGPEVI
jgi:Family of unknown function (DUF5906)